MTIVHTVDIAVTIGRKQIVLIERAKPPFMDKLVMPGGHVEPTDESFATACAREALEEIGLVVRPKDLRFLMTIEGNNDPRPGHHTSQVFTIDFPSLDALGACVAGSDAKAIHLRELASLKPEKVGFDHFQAILKLRKEMVP